MADVKLNTLPQSTSPTATQDLLLFDESTNAGQRINYNTLADVILAKLTSKTYTVAGGTQTLISAIDALNSKFGRALGSNPNFNNIVEPGFYYFGDANNAVNPPNKDAGYLNMLVLRVGDMVTQVVFGARQLSQGGRDKIWVRYRNGNSDSDWNRWIAYATQSEVDALNSKETFNITASTGTWPSEVTLQDTSYAYRFNNIVMIHLNLKIVSTTKKNLVIGSVLPASMRPKFSVFAMGGDGDTDGICQPFTITPEGSISTWNTKTGTTYLQADATYIAKSGT